MHGISLDPQRLQEHLARLLGQPVELLGLRPLGEEEAPGPEASAERIKTFGYGQPVLVEYRPQGAPTDQLQRAVFRTRKRDPFGHEYRADRAAGQLMAFDTFNQLPQHIRALDVGALTQDGELLSLAQAGEFYLITDYAPGRLYAADLQRLREGGPLTALDQERTRALARYLVAIHARKRQDPVLYRRRIRDLVGSGEGIFGLTDSYPPDYPLAPPGWLEEVEKACVAWRWRLKGRTHRLCQVHGDFHPFNVLFQEGSSDFRLLDRSRGPWGEPGDDVSCMAINYLFFSVQRSGKLEGPFAQLWELFWQTYLEASGDQELLEVVAPFFAWRALVVASPVWYQVQDETRRTLYRFIQNVLAQERFDPGQVNRYLEG